jgi:hypothetical protein
VYLLDAIGRVGPTAFAPSLMRYLHFRTLSAAHSRVQRGERIRSAIGITRRTGAWQRLSKNARLTG